MEVPHETTFIKENIVFPVCYNINIIRSTSINQALHLIQDNKIDVILMEYNLPDGNGIDFLNNLLKNNLHVPAIVVTSLGDEMIAAQMIQAGAYNYISKDRLNEQTLIKLIMNTLEKALLKNDLKAAQKKMAEMSIKDSLTNLYNRRYFSEILKKVTNQSIEEKILFFL
jgi:Response regulator containing CheY-like receiver, AAA-type ATPase, and DNA-binding domains